MKRTVSDRRLLILADFLEKLPEERFNFTNWVGFDWKGSPDLSCGTKACALGWATTIPTFRRLGLRLHGAEAFSQACIENIKTNHFNSFAAAEIFGISPKEAQSLFVSGINPCSAWPKFTISKPKQFAELLKEFIADRKRVWRNRQTRRT